MAIYDRLQKLRAKFAEKEIEGILISQPENRYYLSGFHGSAGFLLITQEKYNIAVDFRYVEQAKRQAPDCELCYVAGQMAEWFPKLIGDAGVRRIGFESGDVTFAFYHQMTEILQKTQSPIQLIPISGLIEDLRAVKEPGEIELIKKAAAISDLATGHISRFIKPGMTELQVAWDLEKFMRENGSETMPFEIIVGAGPNGALPHCHPGECIIQPGAPVVLDFGAKYLGYTSDISRTVCAGTPDKTFRKIYDTVLGAQLAAIAIIKEGMTGEEADNIARTVINEAGYGDKFGHSLGHGIGLATHENPRLGQRSTDKLVNGMVFSIEPGIYLPEWGGVRIEDTVMLENGKIRVISQAAK